MVILFIIFQREPIKYSPDGCLKNLSLLFLPLLLLEIRASYLLTGNILKQTSSWFIYSQFIQFHLTCHAATPAAMLQMQINYPIKNCVDTLKPLARSKMQAYVLQHKPNLCISTLFATDLSSLPTLSLTLWSMKLLPSLDTLGSFIVYRLEQIKDPIRYHVLIMIFLAIPKKCCSIFCAPLELYMYQKKAIYI